MCIYIYLSLSLPLSLSLGAVAMSRDWSHELVDRSNNDTIRSELLTQPDLQ